MQIQDVDRGLYTVDGSLHPRKDLQIVKGNVINHLQRPKHKIKHYVQNKVGKSLNTPEVKELVGIRTKKQKKQKKQMLESDRKTRSRTTSFTMTLRF